MFTQVTEIFVTIINTFSAYLGDSIGLSIIAVTLVIRFSLLPLILPSVRSQSKMKDLQPEIDKLKKKYKDDKELFAKKQMELYKEHKVNPLSGCLPQLVQLGLFIAFYQVLIDSLQNGNIFTGSTEFLWLNLTQIDSTFVLPILAAVSQLLLSLMLLPATSNEANEKAAAKTTSKKDDEEALDAGAMTQTIQTQMVFIMPFVTGFFAYKFPSGLALYWVTSNIFSIIQQYYVSGWGGIFVYLDKIKAKLS